MVDEFVVGCWTDNTSYLRPSCSSLLHTQPRFTSLPCMQRQPRVQGHRLLGDPHVARQREQGVSRSSQGWGSAGAGEGGQLGSLASRRCPLPSHLALTKLSWAAPAVRALQWRRTPLGLDFGQQWIDAHIQVAKELGKPLVLEEFGERGLGWAGHGWLGWLLGWADAWWEGPMLASPRGNNCNGAHKEASSRHV